MIIFRRWEIQDPMVIADNETCMQYSDRCNLFNIDSKSKSAGTKGKDSILNVIFKGF